jgi:hypothetical protein
MSIITIGTTKGRAAKTTLVRLILDRFALSGQKAAALAFAAGEIDRPELNAEDQPVSRRANFALDPRFAAFASGGAITRLSRLASNWAGLR